MKRNQQIQVDLNATQPFQVRLKAHISFIQQQCLLLFYQPMIGSQAISLYLTLAAQVNRLNEWSPRRQHAQLLETMSMDLNSLRMARQGLEAVGLVKVYRQKLKAGDQDRPLLCYELVMPLEVEAFVQHPFLSSCLFQTIGDLAYHQLLQDWQVKPLAMDKFDEITLPFTAVFETSKTGEDGLDIAADYQGQYNQEKLDFPQASFKYDDLYQQLQQAGVAPQAFTHAFKREVMAICALYQFNLREAVNLVRLAVNEVTGKIELDQLKEIAERQSYYKQRTTGSTTKQIQTSEQKALEETLRAEYPDLSEQEAEIILLCQQLPPKTFLMKTKQAKGGFATDGEQFYVAEVLEKSQLSATLVNFLIYDLLVRKERSSVYKGELERMANEWQQLKFNHPAQVLAHIKQQHKQKQVQAKYGKGKAKTASYKRTEVVPKWLDQTQNISPKDELQQTQVEPNQADLQARLNQLFKERD